MTTRRAAACATFALAMAGGSLPASSLSQTLQATLDARRDAMPRGKHAWQETWLVPATGTSAPDAAQVTKFGGRVWGYQDGERERLELRAAEGDDLAEPVVVEAGGSQTRVVHR